MANAQQQNLTDPDDTTKAVSPVDIDLDASSTTTDHRADIPPLHVRLGGESFMLQPPDLGLVMELEDATTTRATLALMFDDDWPRAKPHFDALRDPEKVANLVRQYGQHFEIDQDSIVTNAVPNRAARRARRRRK